MPLPHSFTNVGNPLIDATQFNDNFTYLDSGKNREAVQAAAPADQDSTGTPTVITYSSAFATATDVIRGLVFANYTGTDFPALSYKISNLTKNGFSILVSGGQTGSTVDVHFSVIGH